MEGIHLGREIINFRIIVNFLKKNCEIEEKTIK